MSNQKRKSCGFAVTVTFAAAALLWTFGCESKPSQPSPAPPPAPTSATKTVDEKDEHAGHDHAHTAPHGGTLIAIGDHVAHLELVFDAESGKMTGYILDGEAEKGVRIAQDVLTIHIQEHRLKGAAESDASLVTIDLAAVANPLTGEKPGDTSEFAAKLNALKSVEQFSGIIDKITVKGQEFKRVAVKFPGGNE